MTVKLMLPLFGVVVMMRWLLVVGYCVYSKLHLITDTPSSGILHGTTSRSMVCTLLQRRAFRCNKEGYLTDEYKMGFGNPIDCCLLCNGKRLKRHIPIILQLAVLNYDLVINAIGSIYDRTQILLHTQRTLGLSFLCVVNYNNQIVGILLNVTIYFPSHCGMQSCEAEVHTLDESHYVCIVRVMRLTHTVKIIRSQINRQTQDAFWLMLVSSGEF